MDSLFNHIFMLRFQRLLKNGLGIATSIYRFGIISYQIKKNMTNLYYLGSLIKIIARKKTTTTNIMIIKLEDEERQKCTTWYKGPPVYDSNWFVIKGSFMDHLCGMAKRS